MTNSVRVIPIECKFGPTSAYAYYIDAPEPVLIDTGIASSASQEIETVLAENGLSIGAIRWILLTHGHVDHLGGARAVWEKTNGRAEVVIPQKEAYLLRNRSAHLTDYKQLQGKYVDAEIQEKHVAMLMNDIGEDLVPTVEVVGGDRLSFGGDVSMTVVETPGHSIGSVTYVLEGVQWAFAADAVQMYGGALSGIPVIEQPTLYRKSLQHLLEEVRPNRLYLGHHFRDATGVIISPEVEGDAVSAMLQASLEMDAKLVDIVGRHLSKDVQSTESDSLYGPFGSIADEIGYTGDPRNLPCAFFVTMNAYKEELIGEKDK
ncbi:MBL fold metallo-hydrolase [Sporosarcina beigongshangi]|uniref:MBL fold metallo-hydrolase n=1 Tax=Sporosarcina beigongshangi TaxID=2782538 RepID=UPI0019395011|nr:MBL fold metallo-hydrolase [Sporosarcina beigongshangi]